MPKLIGGRGMCNNSRRHNCFYRSKKAHIAVSGVKKRQRNGNDDNNTFRSIHITRLQSMEPLAGIEPATYSLRVNCSTPELQRRNRGDEV